MQNLIFGSVPENLINTLESCFKKIFKPSKSDIKQKNITLPLLLSFKNSSQKEKKHIIEKCKECGVCAKKCPIVKHTDLAEVLPQDIQKQIKAYLENGEAHQTIFARAFSCMECFKCMDKCCPEGLNPLLVNEIIKWEYRQNKIEEMVYGNPKDEATWLGELWRIPAEGGEPQNLGLTMKVYQPLSFHPDGRRIAFTGPGLSLGDEVWAMENFLPTASK